MSGARRSARTLAALCTALVVALACATAAQAGEFGIEPGSFAVSTSTAQAGAHPDLNVRFQLRSDHSGDQPMPFDAAKTVVADLPPGLIGNPGAVPRCAMRDFPHDCAPETQVGTIYLRTGLVSDAWAAVYNLVPSNDAPAEFGFLAYVVPIRIQVAVRSDGDYGLRTRIDTLPTVAPLVESDLTLWGVPADASHDPDRKLQCFVYMGFRMCSNEGGVPSSDPRRSFMTNAATCGPQEPARIAIDAWQRPGAFDRAEAQLPDLVGCDRAAFEGRATVRSQEPKAGAPSGYTVELDVPQNDDPDGLATPSLKTAVVRLPAGTVVSPSASDGLQSCSDAQLALGTLEAARCPEASKIGTVSIDTPLLPVPLTGDVFLADQTPQQLLRIVLVAEARGVRLKLPGRIDLDQASGQLTATFDQNPQLPFHHLRVDLKGGPRAVLSNPRQCGTATSTAVLTPFGGAAASTSSDAFAVSGDGAGGPCAGTRFAPTFSAGSSVATAGVETPFTLTFAREDADEALGSIDATLPPGVMPRIASVPLCAEAQAAAGTCGEASRVGGAVTHAGPGSQPFGLPGRVYVTGPYKGAPYGLSIVVPAKAGPLDLGTVVVRAAVHVDLRSAALRIISDPLPTMLQGIPLQLRSIRVAIDRPGFMRTPTSCAARAVSATIGSAGGAAAQVASRYQAADCRRLPFAPQLSVQVGGRGQVGPRRPTSLVATMTQTEGQAAARSVRLELPRSLSARLEIVNRACTQAAYDAGNCGERARIGTANATTPLLGAPLQGSAYFVRNPARRLPDIVVQLRGEVAIDLVGEVAIRRTQLVTTFGGIPDVPLTRFQLALPAQTSPVASVSGLCKRAGRQALARQGLRGQNGKLVQRKARLSVAGCAKAKAKPRATTRGKPKSKAKPKANAKPKAKPKQ